MDGWIVGQMIDLSAFERHAPAQQPCAERNIERSIQPRFKNFPRASRADWRLVLFTSLRLAKYEANERLCLALGCRRGWTSGCVVVEQHAEGGMHASNAADHLTASCVSGQD